MSKDTFYFSHDAGARNDERMIAIRAEFGWEGYGWYFAICELFRESSDYTLSRSIAMLDLSIGTGKPSIFTAFLKLCFETELFLPCEDNPERFYSETFMRRMEKVDAIHKINAERGRKGGLARAAKIKKISSPSIVEVELKSSNEIKVKEIKEKEIVSVVFSPANLKFWIDQAEEWRTKTCVTYKISLIEISNYATTFIAEQEAKQKVWSNAKDSISHFLSWMKLQKQSGKIAHEPIDYSKIINKHKPK